jgi:hypothetical protein
MATFKFMAAASVTALLALAGCSSAEPQTQPVVTTVVETVTETVAAPTPEPAAPTQQAPAAVPPVTTGVIPDVIGVNHQLAQDTMQAAGFYNLSEEDATGQGRMLVSDRNWVVASQEPKPGTKAPLDVTIILRSKKLTD